MTAINARESMHELCNGRSQRGSKIIERRKRWKTSSQQYPVRLLFQMLSILLYNRWHLCNLILVVTLFWDKKGYPMILNAFRDTIADLIISR